MAPDASDGCFRAPVARHSVSSSVAPRRSRAASYPKRCISRRTTRERGSVSRERWCIAATGSGRSRPPRSCSRTLRATPDYLDLKAFALLRLGEFEAAAGTYRALLTEHPGAESWKSYGQALKALARTDEAVAAYRQSIAQTPSYGMAHWCLAELKTFRFEPVRDRRHETGAGGERYRRARPGPYPFRSWQGLRGCKPARKLVRAIS